MSFDIPKEYVLMHEEMIDRVLARYGDLFQRGFFVPLSGGLDSATVLTFACGYADRVGWNRQDVQALFCYRKNMYPDEEEDLSNAEKISNDSAVTLHLLDITPIYEGLGSVISYSSDDLLADESICRARALATRTLEDKLGRPSMDTGNASEEFLGQWTTGAYAGRINVIGNAFKTEVKALAEKIGVPAYILGRRKRSSELRAGTLFEDYERIDPILFSYLAGKDSHEISEARNEDHDFVQKIVDRVQSQTIHAFTGEPVVEPSLTHLNPRIAYLAKCSYNPVVKKLHELRCKRWGS